MLCTHDFPFNIDLYDCIREEEDRDDETDTRRESFSYVKPDIEELGNACWSLLCADWWHTEQIDGKRANAPSFRRWVKWKRIEEWSATLCSRWIEIWCPSFPFHHIGECFLVVNKSLANTCSRLPVQFVLKLPGWGFWFGAQDLWYFWLYPSLWDIGRHYIFSSKVISLFETCRAVQISIFCVVFPFIIQNYYMYFVPE